MSRDNIQIYKVFKTASQPSLDGTLDDINWKSAAWTEDFVDIRGISSPSPRFQTRAKMLYDEKYFYIGAEIYDTDIWNTLSEKNCVVFWENDFEVFLDPAGKGRNYYEFEMNALNTIWELTLDKPYNQGGMANSPTNIDGLISAVHVYGTLNQPGDVDEKWTVNIAIPWTGMIKHIDPTTQTLPPTANDEWRVNFSRVQWKFKIKDGKYVRVPKENDLNAHHEDNWVWSTQHAINMHEPKHWGRVIFSGQTLVK